MGTFGIFTFFKNRASPDVEQGISAAITGNFGDDIAVPLARFWGASTLIARDGKEYMLFTGPRKDNNQKRRPSGT
jgi:hypothetical protein